MNPINSWRVWALICFCIQFLVLKTIHCTLNIRDSESEYSTNFSEKSQADPKKFSLLLYTVISQVFTECNSLDSENLVEYSKNLRNLSKLIIQDFDNCEKILTDEIPPLFFPFITSPNIEHGHSIAYEICCRLRSSISADSELTILLGNSTKYLDYEDYVKTSMETINKFDGLSDIPSSTIGLIYSTTLDSHKGITSKKSKLRNLPYEDDINSKEQIDSNSDGMIFSFDVKAAPFMNSNTQQYIYTYYHHSDNSKCLGLTKKQLEMVETIKKISVNAKDMPRIPLDIACTAMWFISQRWDFCPLVFKQLMEVKGSSSIKFCEMVKRAATERTKFITKTLKISDSFLTMRATKILNYVETVLKLNSKYFPDSEITSKDVADIIYIGDSDIFVEENDNILLKELRRNRVERKFNTNKEFPKNNILGLRYPNYRRNRHNFTSIFDHIMYSENHSNDNEKQNLLLLPLEFKRSPDWTSENHLGSNSKEVVSSKTVLQTYYIPPPSSFIPNDVSNWITGPCCWLDDKYKHLPSLIISISKKKGYKLHILNACEAIFTLINESGESCASVLISAVFLVFSIQNFSEASDICSETAIRASLPFYPKKNLKSTLFPTDKLELVTLYEGLVVALCLELGIVLDIEDIHQIIFSDYPTKNSLVPRSTLNYLLYRALKLPNDFGKIRNFWNWSTQMYTRISNKQAKVILINRATQLTLEIAQVTNEIEIMNDILEKARKDSNVSNEEINHLKNSKRRKEIPKTNYLHHYNYDFELANFDSIELNLVKLEKLRYDLTIEKEKIAKYINTLSSYIGSKIYDIPSNFVNKKFSPLYKPSVFKINMYDSTKLQTGYITTRSTRNLHHLIDNEPINKYSDVYPPKINYSIKTIFQEIQECKNLTDKGLDLAIYSRELFSLHLNIQVSIPFCCDIIMRMHPNINIKDSFIHSAYSVLNYKFTNIDYSDIEEIWLKIVPIFSIPSGNLFKTRFYQFIDYNKDINFESNNKCPIQLFNKYPPSNKAIILDDATSTESQGNVKKGYYAIPDARPISNQVKKPKNLSCSGEDFKEILDLSYVDKYWDNNSTKQAKKEHDELLNNEYRTLKEKVMEINNELAKIYEKLRDPKFVDKSNFFHVMASTLKEDKKRIKTRIIHLAGVIAETEVKYASETGILIPNNVRRLADLHKINSISHSDILKLKADDSGTDHTQRIRELEAKINNNNTEMYKIIEIEGNDLDDPRWYSNMDKCLSSFIPRRKEVKSLDPTSGIKQFYFVSKDYYYMDSSPKCTSNQLEMYKFVIKDLRKLFVNLNIPLIKIRGKKFEDIERHGLIDPRKMEHWENLHGILYEDNKTACSYIKNLLKKIVPVRNLDLKEFMNSPVFIIWCANHIRSRLGNEDIWRNIFGLIWIIFYTKPFKPKDFVWRNIMLV
ncbi:uncharacterized protein ELE39_003559 [Cryptosporidium sp. chipmunk genotype I]|uniref:uncharacterized protein n=1 Tax=Cryptosporidium sp. chipmunk genotype I TaxID=1280935 RepID=UPI00351A4B85|nr:hypothetical protein ELE39_003559 [Cryptosporidium sp. chipmunk genotype I]